MTTEELGQLFPIELTDPNPNWKHIFVEEKEKIKKCLGQDNFISIEHIGSTTIPNIQSKPTIDMILVLPEKANLEEIINQLKRLKYHHISRPENPPPHMIFAKGYTKDGIKGQTFHVHPRYDADCHEILFRDYLLEHPETANEYENLKQKLANQFRNDREAYTDGKTKFVNSVVELATREIKLR